MVTMSENIIQDKKFVMGLFKVLDRFWRQKWYDNKISVAIGT